ncbi:hypothetical protein D3C80_2098660 [compost metagenome]
MVPGTGDRRRFRRWRLCGAQHHLRFATNGGARRIWLYPAQNALPDVAADPGICVGGNAGAKPAPSVVHQQREL